MQGLVAILSAVMLFAPTNAILGLEYGPALSSVYGPYYMGLRKGVEAEKALSMPQMYGPILDKETLFLRGKGFPYYYPLATKEKELEFQIGKGFYNPIIAKEKAIGSGIGKGFGKVPF